MGGWPVQRPARNIAGKVFTRNGPGRGRAIGGGKVRRMVARRQPGEDRPGGQLAGRVIGSKGATRLGFEPRMREPKSLVLPLHYRVGSLARAGQDATTMVHVLVPDHSRLTDSAGGKFASLLARFLASVLQ